VTQGAINKMAELRQQGVSYQEIGARLGCSERTVRRYVGHVQPRLQIPPTITESEAQDPREMRSWLARHFVDWAYRFNGYPAPRLSIAFMAEAARDIEERLEGLPALTLELLMKDSTLRVRFLKEALGWLYRSYRGTVLFEASFGHMTVEDAAATWTARDIPAESADDDTDELGEF